MRRMPAADYRKHLGHQRSKSFAIKQLYLSMLRLRSGVRSVSKSLLGGQHVQRNVSNHIRLHRWTLDLANYIHRTPRDSFRAQARVETNDGDWDHLRDDSPRCRKLRYTSLATLPRARSALWVGLQLSLRWIHWNHSAMVHGTEIPGQRDRSSREWLGRTELLSGIASFHRLARPPVELPHLGHSRVHNQHHLHSLDERPEQTDQPEPENLRHDTI